MEAVKPICQKNKCVLVLSDTLENIGDRYYIKATAGLIDIEDTKGDEIATIENTAYAREEESKKGMDGSQITGTASSYARKYALNGLFNIDDTKDADTNEFKKQQENEYQVTEEVPKLSSEEIKILEATQKKYKLTDEKVKDILIKYGYRNYKDILKSDYAKIGNELSKGE